MRGLVALFLSLMLLGPTAFATELYEPYVSARAAGMGNAYTSLVSDKDAVFYNPAALTKVHGFNLTIADPLISTDAQDIASVSNNLKSANSTASFGSYFGRQIYLGVYDSVGIWVHDFAAVGYDAMSLSFDLRNPADPSSAISATNDLGLAAGVGFSLGGFLSMGFVGKRVTRYGLRTTLGAATLSNLGTTAVKDVFNAVGTGYGLDMGVLLSIPTPVSPTFSFVWKDMGQTKFIPLSSQNGTPPVQDNELIAGFGLDIDAFVMHIRPTVDVKHINLWNEQVGKKLHTGLELAFPFFSARTGLHQGYPTYGVGADFWWVHFDVASYGVELATYPGQREDRRYLAQLTLQVNLDPDFGFLSGGTGNGPAGTGSGSGAGGRAPKPRR